MESRLVASSEGTNLYLLQSSLPSKDAETIIFLHGYPDTHNSWEKQMDHFSKNYRVAAFDLRGAGKSSVPAEQRSYRMSELIRDTDRVIDELVGKSGKVHLVGHDWGSIIFWSYISLPENQKRVLSFSAVSCPHPMLFYKNIFGKLLAFQPESIYEGLQQVLKSYYMLFFQFPWIPEFVWENFTSELWTTLMKSSGLPESDSMNKLTPEEIKACTVHTVNLYREIFKNGAPHLPRVPIQIPISVFIPEDDLAITPEAYDGTDSIARNLKINRIQANHWVHRERPDWFNQNLGSFLRSVK